MKQADSIIAAFEAGAVIVQFGPYEDANFIMYARDFGTQVHMGKPRMQTCTERMGIES